MTHFSLITPKNSISKYSHIEGLGLHTFGQTKFSLTALDKIEHESSNKSTQEHIRQL